MQQETEPRTCHNIRRNIRIESAELQAAQIAYRSLRADLARLNEQVRTLERDRAELYDLDDELPMTIPGPDLESSGPRGRWRVLYHLLRRLGQALDIRDLFDGLHRARRVAEADQELKRRLAGLRVLIDNNERSLRQRSGEINRLERQIAASFYAHARFECSGKPFNSFVFDPPDRLRWQR